MMRAGVGLALLGVTLLGCSAGHPAELDPIEEDAGFTPAPEDVGTPVDAPAPAKDVVAVDVPTSPPDDLGVAPVDVPPPPRDAGTAPDVGRPAGGGYCAPCTTNEDCATGGLCVRSPAGEMLCAVPCGPQNQCGAEQRCVGVQTNAGVIPQCVPTSGTCRGGGGFDAGTAPPRDAGSPPADLGPAPDAGPVAAFTPGTVRVTLGARRALRYVPQSYRAGGAGLVLLHGNGDTASNFLATSGMQPVADAQGFVIVLPEAIAGSAPMGVDWDAYTRPMTANGDMLLVRAARDHLVAGGVDARRVFLAGQSQGGYLAYHAAMAMSALFGAVNVTAAADPLPGLNLAGMATRRIPVDLLAGSGEFALANVQRTRDDLRARGFEVRYTELPGVGHCCPLSTRTGTAPSVAAWLLARPLP